MDIITHAVVGAFAGLPTGNVVLGAVVGVVPDVVLGIRRKIAPTRLYRATHGVLLPTVLALALWPLCGYRVALTVWVAWAAHIALDVITHGPIWSPRLFYPFSDWHYDRYQEWEYGNESWKDGLYYAFILCALFMWFSVIGHIW